MNGSRCKRMLNMVLSAGDEEETGDRDDNDIVDGVDITPSSCNFSYLLRSSMSIEGVESLEKEEEPILCNQPLSQAICVASEVPINDVETTLLDISHPLPEPVEITTNENDLLKNNHENLIPLDNLLTNTPTSQNHKNLPTETDYIPSPTVLFINKEYDLQSISDLEGILGTIEKENESQNEIRGTPTVVSRKRKKNKQEWNDKKNKILKDSGQSYESKKSKKIRAEKSMGLSCTCKMKCFEKLDDSTREKLHKKFWAIGDHERQWDFIVRYVKTVGIRKMTLERKNNRTQTIGYTLPSDIELKNPVKVCKTMFLNTLSITQQVVYTALEKSTKQEPMSDLRGTHTNRPKKMTESTETSIMKHIDLFEKVESHYIRKDSQREYLDETLNVSKMHRFYLEWINNEEEFQDVTRATKRQYEYIFNTKFNLSFHKPKKDLCDTCTIYKNADSKRKEELKDAYEKHLAAKEIVRQLKEQEKTSFNKNDSVLACFDLEKVLGVPQCEIGIFYYKRKFPIYNFTVYDTLTLTGYCYLWHCQIAKRGAIEIASCLWLFIKDQAELGKKTISLYSDSCAGQNRNRFVFAMLALACKTFTVKITHRFFEKGHSQSEGDSMHATIERAKKGQTIYNPDQMYHIIENAKVTGNKYIIKHMEQTDFLNFKETIKGNNWLNDSRGNKIYWSKVKEVSFSPENVDIVNFKYDLQETQLVLNNASRTNSRRRRLQRPIQDLPDRAYHSLLPIALPLYKDLISLCDSDAIPRQYQNFYRSLEPAEVNNAVPNSDDSDDE